MFTIETISTETGSTYVVSGCFGALFVTRYSGHEIEGVKSTIGQTVPVDEVTQTQRASGVDGRVKPAMRFVGGPWDGVITSCVTMTVEAR